MFSDFTMYVPKADFVVKIADFGLSSKYSTPMILTNSVAIKEFELIPNFYSPFYDLGTAIMSMSSILRLKNDTLLLCLSYLIGEYKDGMNVKRLRERYIPFFEEQDENVLSTFFEKKYRRPRINMLKKKPFSDVKIEDILRSEIFDKYRVKPKGNIIVVARL